MSLLSTLWSFRKFIGMGLAGLALMAGLWYVRHLQTDNTRLRTDLAVAVQAAQENAAVVSAVQERAEKSQKALTDSHKAELARLKKSEKIREDISHAPVTTACVSSPAIVAAFGSLRGTAVPQAAAGQDTASR